MKFAGSIACLVVSSSLLSFSSAFVVAPPRANYNHHVSSRLAAAKQTKPASSKEEDLELTRQVIANFAGIETSSEAEPTKKEEVATAGAGKEE